MHTRTIACSAVTLLLFAVAVPAQTGQPQTTPPASAAAQPAIPSQELYHVHFAKAAPGKLNELIAAYQQAPVAPGEPGRPVVLRHLQGDDWDLLVLTPLGTEETITPNASAEEQQVSARMRGLRTQHGDTFTSGPPWSELSASLLGTAAPAGVGAGTTAATGAGTTGTAGTGATGTAGTGTTGGAAGTATAANVPEGTVYTVTTYRSLPGHRDQLADALRRVAALFPDRRTILQHVEGAPWEFVVIQRFDSWAALGEEQAAPPDRLRAQGFANSEAVGLELRQHAAEHRDTIARLVR